MAVLFPTFILMEAGRGEGGGGGVFGGVVVAGDFGRGRGGILRCGFI